MVVLEEIYYLVFILIAVLTISAVLKNKTMETIRTAYRVSKRIEGTLDTIDEMENSIDDIMDRVEENNNNVSRLQEAVSETQRDVSDIKEAVAATVLFRNGNLDENKVLDELKIGDKVDELDKFKDEQ